MLLADCQSKASTAFFCAVFFLPESIKYFILGLNGKTVTCVDNVEAIFVILQGSCRKITDRHKGAIAVKSTPGEGTAFFITLPEKQAVL
ncbi:MAG TPA: hypothetical protein DCX78_04685 [Nitrospina sp.]|nr:hypothetical protein [Nitrospina sp.]